jgi:tetratricopeptide (TPR) repeat protein
MGQHQAALADCDRAIELDAESEWAIACRADAYHKLARYNEALADYDMVLDLVPDDAELLADRGKTLLAMGRSREAFCDLIKATELDPALTDDLRPYLNSCQLGMGLAHRCMIGGDRNQGPTRPKPRTFGNLACKTPQLPR